MELTEIVVGEMQGNGRFVIVKLLAHLSTFVWN